MFSQWKHTGFVQRTSVVLAPTIVLALMNPIDSGGTRDASGSYLDAKAENLLFGQKTMLSTFAGIVARCAIMVGAVFILSRTVPRNKLYRFVFLFVLCVPLNLIYNYVNVLFLGYHKMGWTGALIIAFFVAMFGSFWSPDPQNSNTPGSSKS